MEILIVLFLLIGVFVVMTAAGLCISYAVGKVLYDRERPKAEPGEPDQCAQCDADRDWYEAMPGPKQVALTAWWWVNRMTWVSKGCR